MNWLSILATGLATIGLMARGPTESAGPCTDPALGEVEEECGVWVSASLGSDTGLGTKASPMASLTAAAALAHDTNRDVYACGEVWTEPLSLPENVSLHGGFDCERGWAYKGKAFRARIETGPGEVPLRIESYGGTMVVTDFKIKAADAVVPGGSSIAAVVEQPNTITFRRCVIMAGAAADGADGEVVEAPAMAGAAGNPGGELPHGRTALRVRFSLDEPGSSAPTRCQLELSGSGAVPLLIEGRIDGVWGTI